MKVESVNRLLRQMFEKLINDGYKKRHICALTLGVQSEPQFEGFIQGRDFGIKPLQRIIDAFGYEMQLVMVDKKDKQVSEWIESINQTFLENCKEKIVTNLDNEELVKSSSVLKSGVLAEVSEELFNQLK